MSRSIARARLSQLMEARGERGVLLVFKQSGQGGTEFAEGPALTPGTMAYPPCQCPEHRAGRGRPDAPLTMRDIAGARKDELRD